MIKTPDKITFHNRNKEANFWQKDFTRAWKRGKQVEVQFAKNLSETINVRFESNTMGVLRSKAKKKGLGATQLIRMWVLDRLSA